MPAKCMRNVDGCFAVLLPFFLLFTLFNQTFCSFGQALILWSFHHCFILSYLVRLTFFIFWFRCITSDILVGCFCGLEHSLRLLGCFWLFFYNLISIFVMLARFMIKHDQLLKKPISVSTINILLFFESIFNFWCLGYRIFCRAYLRKWIINLRAATVRGLCSGFVWQKCQSSWDWVHPMSCKLLNTCTGGDFPRIRLVFGLAGDTFAR